MDFLEENKGMKSYTLGKKEENVKVDEKISFISIPESEARKILKESPVA